MSHDTQPIAHPPTVASAPPRDLSAPHWAEHTAAPWAAPHVPPYSAHPTFSGAPWPGATPLGARSPRAPRRFGAAALMVLASLGVAKLFVGVGLMLFSAGVYGPQRYGADNPLVSYMWLVAAVAIAQLVAGLVALGGSAWTARADGNAGPIVVTVAMGLVGAVSMFWTLVWMLGGEPAMGVLAFVDVLGVVACIALAWTSARRRPKPSGRRLRHDAVDGGRVAQEPIGPQHGPSAPASRVGTAAAEPPLAWWASAAQPEPTGSSMPAPAPPADPSRHRWAG